jgi:hypothetical protein
MKIHELQFTPRPDFHPMSPLSHPGSNSGAAQGSTGEESG